MGGLYETSAIPESTQGVALVDGRKFGYGLGTTWSHGAFSLDVGWLQTFLEPMEITDSEVKSIIVEALQGEVVEGKVVGNGEFTSRLDMVAAGLSWRFGQGGD